jgi:WD40 repeat protein
MTEAFGAFGGSKALLCGGDNRVSQYEADAQRRERVFVEKNHLAHSYSSFAWTGSSSSSSSSSSKRRNSGPGDAADELLAVGCSDGTVVVWNLTTGVVTTVLGTANETPAPTDLAFSNDHAHLFVSSQSSVVQYGVKDGVLAQSLKAGKHGALKIAMNPKASVLAIAKSVSPTQ